MQRGMHDEKMGQYYSWVSRDFCGYFCFELFVEAKT